MSPPGSPGMVNEYILPQNAMQHHDSNLVIFWREKKKKKKKALSGVRSRARESLASHHNTFNSWSLHFYLLFKVYSTNTMKRIPILNPISRANFFTSQYI